MRRQQHVRVAADAARGRVARGADHVERGVRYLSGVERVGQRVEVDARPRAVLMT
ncbi:MAG: hypothetical protein U0736_15900 [Gemmataceae bacterium]